MNRFLLLALVLSLGTGCRWVQNAANVPGQAVRAVTPGSAEKNTVDPVELQQRLLRFADDFIAGMVSSVERLQRGTNPISPAEALKWKLVLATEGSSIASGPNAFANLLDMTVFVTAARITVEDYWQPRVYGESAQPLLNSSRHFETQIWTHAATLLKPEQVAELREAIVAWRQVHPLPENVLGARALGFATEVAKTQRTAARESSVFSLLRLDPLAGLSPATREIAQTRLFAERALYIAQWMPTLLRWQTELLALNSVAMPEVQQLLTNTTQLAASVGSFARVAEQVPKQFSTEREEILKALQSQEEGLTALAAELHQTVVAGTAMSTSLNTTLTTFDALMKRFGVGEPDTTPPNTNSPPFNILDYARTAEQIAAMAQQLDAVIKDAGSTLESPALDARLQAVNRLSDHTTANLRGLIYQIFLLAAALVLFSFGCAWVYRAFGRRADASRSNKAAGLDPK